MAVLAPALTSLADEPSSRINEGRLHRLGKVINWVVKVRGWKVIGELRFAPLWTAGLTSSLAFSLRHLQPTCARNAPFPSSNRVIIKYSRYTPPPTPLITRCMATPSSSAPMAGLAPHRTVQPRCPVVRSRDQSSDIQSVLRRPVRPPHIGTCRARRAPSTSAALSARQ